MIGDDINGGSPTGIQMEGLIDEVRIYNRALTAAEIQAAVQAATSPPPPLFAYTANVGSTDVSVVDVAAGTVVATIPIVGGTGGPIQLTRSPDGSRVYTTDSTHLHTIDTATNAVVGTLSLQGQGRDFPSGIAVSPDGSRVYVSHYGPGCNNAPGSVSVIDTASNSLVTVIPNTGVTTEDVAVSADGSRIWVSSGGCQGSDSLIRVYETTTFGSLGTIDMGTAAVRELGISPDGTRVYVAIQSGPMFLKEIDTTIGPVGSLIDTVTLNIPCCLGGIEVSPDGSTVYVGTNSDQSKPVAVDPVTNQVTLITGIPAQGRPLFMALSADGGRIVTANLSADNVSVVDPSSNSTVGSPISVGTTPIGIALITGAAAPDNLPPVADAGPDQPNVEWTGDPVQLDGTGSSDVDDDPLTYQWSATGITFDDSTSATPEAIFPLGKTTVTLVVNDGTVDSGPDTVDIIVEDTTAPDVTVELVPVPGKVEDDEGLFTALFDCNDACDDNPVLTGVISTPSLDGLIVKLKTKSRVKVVFDLDEGKVKIEGPDPTAVLAELQQNGGLVIASGQLVLSQLGFGNCLRKRLRLLPFFRSVDVGGWQPWDENGMWSGWKGKNETSWND